jgi:hypothetical protein
MPRRREVRRHPSLPTVSQAEPTTKPGSLTAAIRRFVILDQTANAKALEVRLVEAGFNGTKLSTIATIRADTLATLREAAALGLLRTAEDSSQLESRSPRPARSRSRSRKQAVTVEAEAATA